jgi:HNH endonuclease
MAPGERALGTVLLALFGAAIAFVVIRNAVAKREWIIWHAKWKGFRFVIFFLAFLVTWRLLVLAGLRGWWVQYVAMALCAPFLRPIPKLKRTRGIPKAIKRAVIQEHVARTGRLAEDDEVDHIVPFSKGGGHTKDNLRVVPRKVNREKGSRCRGWKIGCASPSAGCFGEQGAPAPDPRPGGGGGGGGGGWGGEGGGGVPPPQPPAHEKKPPHGDHSW